MHYKWETIKLGAVLERIVDPVSVAPDKTYQEIGIRSHGKGLFDKEPVKGETLGNKRVYWLHPYCFIVNIVFAWEQAVGKTRESDIGKIASHRFPMYSPKDDKVDVDYLVNFFNTRRGKHLLGLASPGGAGRNKTLGQKEFSLLKLKLPPIKEQNKIAQILSCWDKAIELTEKLIQAKTKLKKGLMQQLLTGKKRFQEYQREKWATTKLQKVCHKFQNGGTPSRGNDEYWKGNIPWITGADIEAQRIKTVRRRINTKALRESATNLVEKGVLLIVTRTGVGKITIAPYDLAFSQDITGAYVKQNFLLNIFLFHYLDFSLKKIARLNQGTSINGILRNDLINHIIFIPSSLKEQQKIASVLSACDKEIEILNKQLDALKQQKKGLMQKLLTGKVRVKIVQEPAAEGNA